MKKRLYIAIGCLFLFLLLLALIITKRTEWLDEPIYRFVIGRMPEWKNTFFKGITHIGDTIPLIILTISCLVLLRTKKDRWMLLSSAMVSLGMNQVIKRIVARPRPPLERRIITQGGYSFPSGHTMMSIAIFGVLLYLCATKVKNKPLRITGIILLTLLILLIAVSRIYVGVHYPSDVIGGALLSIALLIGDISFINYHFKGE